MNANNKESMYETVPVVSELNKVAGFDPLKYLRKTKNGWNLDLKIKKLWFRLKYPAGRTRMVTVKITDQLAIMEARVYFDKNDSQPAANFTAQRDSKTTPGGLYIEAAQHEAMDEALSAAGFGIQFISANVSETERVHPHVPSDAHKQEERREMPPATEKKPSEPMKETVTEEVVQPAVKEIVPEAPEKPVETEVKPSGKTEPAVLPQQAVEEKTAPESAQSTQEETPAETVHEEISETHEIEESTAAYTKEMAVDDICALMTVEDAGNIIVPAGTCKGWTLSQVAERRPVSLKWYLTGYSGDDNILRAGAKIMQAMVEAKKAS